ncbi:MAG: hypothetical protein APF77_03795 [Clostridia bacterium BRH_c25]|nr:MAG: hypothetical protein APF77_03795 [Clostridia bacterium BRH_c25]
MLRIVLIDDEPSALAVMELLFSEFRGVCIAGRYTRGMDALQAIEKDRPDAVFVDIEMPGKNGLDIAVELADKYPEINVVFVTVYNQYAVAAFEASAADYLLKPVRKERLEKTIARLQKAEKGRNGRNGSREGDGGARIQCFGKFMVYAPSGAPLGWRTRKTEELMALLVYYRHRELSKERIIDLLWPETEVEKAGVLFHTTLYNLKKSLGEMGGRLELTKGSGGYRLQFEDLACDTEEFEKMIPSPEHNDDESIEAIERLLAIYAGGYFEEDGYLWAEEKRYELQSRLIGLCLEAGNYCLSMAMWEKAAEMQRSIIRIDDLNQEAYEALIMAYARLGNTGMLLQAYNQYISAMEELGITPESLEELKERR